jgi:hypothetical protein
MKKHLMLCVALLLTVLSVSAFASVVLASTTPHLLDGKGAAAQWNYDATRKINAYVVMSDSGKDGTIYVSIQHNTGVSAASGPATFQWSMDHVTVVAEDLMFSLTGDTSGGRAGPHDIFITWETKGATSHGELNVNTNVGLTGTVSGQWKPATATFSMDPTTAGHHLGDSWQSTWGVVFKGTADLDITLPYIPPT